MKAEIIKNPEELQVISNPNQKTKPMAKSKNELKKGIGEYKNQAKTAAYILGGQALGAQANALVVANVLQNANATVQQIARVVIPGVTGVGLALTKNEHAKGLSLGFGVQSVLEAIKFVMPDWSPQSAFNDSTFVFQDENGRARRVAVSQNGELVAENGEKLMLKAPGDEKTSKISPEAEESLDDSMYTAEGDGEMIYV